MTLRIRHSGESRNPEVERRGVRNATPAPSLDSGFRRNDGCGHLRAIFVVLMLAAVFAGPANAADRLLVFAAASLQGTVDTIARRFEKAGGSPVATSFAASSTLARQIERGAPADVYVSASPKWTDRLEAGRWLRPGTLGDLLGNRLVLVAPAGQAAAVPIHHDFPLSRLLGNGRLVMGDPSHVPAGQYARAALDTLGVWRTVAGRVAGTPTVRHALALVARGEAPYGIVYATDARADPNVAVVGVFPEEYHPPIRYTVAVPAASTHPQAERFLNFLWSRPARSVFEGHGFAVKGTGH